ncbi:urease accessory protein UreF [Desertibaculum subflavum]|uniref:urease accessory protein UreF n=1 Tax=Desertibaculum subflavum TaxID=2268458 RepID=UPI000E669C0A
MTTSTDAAGWDAGALYRLLAWTSPAYPIGAYTYSHGIEYAVEEGLVRDRATLADWIGWILRHGAGLLDSVLFAESYRAAGDGARLAELTELGRALRGSAETALESRQQGMSFLTITRTAWPDPQLDAAAGRLGEEVPLAIAVALAAAGRVPLEPALTGYLHAFAANLVSAGVRLVPLGQTDGQRALAALEPVVRETVAVALATPIEEAGSAAPMVDWTSMRHETQYTRLFRS